MTKGENNQHRDKKAEIITKHLQNMLALDNAPPNNILYPLKTNNILYPL